VSGNQIVRCAIHPGIGVARVGNSPTEYFIGPEVPGHTPDPGGVGYKDAQGRIKRQAARFRLYGLDASGAVVREITAADGDITWTVHLANKKAAWYQFKLALDIPEATAAPLPPDLQGHRRNAGVTGNARQQLVIDPGPRSIKGANAQGTASFDTGTFLGTRVPLGELRTDAQGHLLVFGGLGHAASPHNAPLATFANNDGWFDDIADGPISARVVIAGKEVPVAPAWALVTPPHYAPGIQAIVTLYDIAYQAYLDAHPPQAPAPVSFARDIYPLLERFDRLQWVNEGFYRGYGWGGQVPLLAPARLAHLASAAPADMQARRDIVARFRDPASPALQEDAWPRVYGDSFDQPPRYPQQYLAVTREQYRRLGAWAQGHAAADWPGAAPVPPQHIEDLPLAARPGVLDEAALAACAGGPFHPGTEATWPLRRPSMYADLCRLNARPDNQQEPDYGDVLTPARALGADGPLHRSGPGDLTRWMAVPWQTDTASCGSAYPNSTQTPSPLPDLPTFWPAAVPNRVLTQQAYRRILDGGLSPAARRAAFDQRVPWARHLAPTYDARLAQFVADWPRMGIVERQPGPAHDPAYPAEMRVERENEFAEAGLAPPGLPGAPAPRIQSAAAPVGGGGGADEMGNGAGNAGGGADVDAALRDLPAQPLLDDWRAHL